MANEALTPLMRRYSGEFGTRFAPDKRKTNILTLRDQNETYPKR